MQEGNHRATLGLTCLQRAPTKRRMISVPTALLLSLRQLADGRIWAIIGKSVAISLAIFAAIAFGGWNAVDWALARGGLADESFAGADAIRGALATIAALLGLWILWRIVAMAVIQFFADEVVAVVEARHYPAAARARELPVKVQARNALRASGRALLANLIALPLAVALLVTGVGAALVFFVVNAVLLGWELRDMVWLRQPASDREAAPLGAGERLLLGGAASAMLAIPGLNLLAPVLSAAGATHLINRKTPLQ